MSWQKRSIQLIVGLPLAMPIISYAINIGDTYVQSQQNQPLQASINVSDIDPKTFSVQLSSNSTYQQMGLAKEDGVVVRFEPTSSDGGRIILTSKRPIATPFADVVLDVSNRGELKVLPKTLLMPINESQRIVTQPSTRLVNVPTKKVTIGNDTSVNLPKLGQPLAVINAEPPPMDLPTANLPTQTINQAPIVVSNKVTPTTTSQMPVSAQTANPTTAPNAVNTGTSENLMISETRRIYPVDANTALQANSTQDALTNQANNTQPQQVTKQVTRQVNKPTRYTAKASAKAKALQADATASQPVTYVIQRNDNLWTIANRIAKQNNSDVNQVMQNIVANNPNAFVNNDPAQMVANSQLALPTYSVTPSKTGIKAAKKLSEQRRARQNKASSNTTARTTKQRTEQRANAKPTQVTPRPQAKAAKNPLAAAARRRSEMTIIAPNQRNGSAQGGSQKASKRSKNQVAPEMAQTLQKKRQLTAKQAQNVSKLEQNLASADQRLKVQNVKLAQLEQRLKQLNNP